MPCSVWLAPRGVKTKRGTESSDVQGHLGLPGMSEYFLNFFRSRTAGEKGQFTLHNCTKVERKVERRWTMMLYAGIATDAPNCHDPLLELRTRLETLLGAVDGPCTAYSHKCVPVRLFVDLITRVVVFLTRAFLRGRLENRPIRSKDSRRFLERKAKGGRDT